MHLEFWAMKCLTKRLSRLPLHNVDKDVAVIANGAVHLCREHAVLMLHVIGVTLPVLIEGEDIFMRLENKDVDDGDAEGVIVGLFEELNDAAGNVFEVRTCSFVFCVSRHAWQYFGSISVLYRLDKSDCWVLWRPER